MHKGRSEKQARIQLKGGSIEAMLHQVRPYLSESRYQTLCREVNEAESYSARKGLIFASVQARAQKQSRFAEE